MKTESNIECLLCHQILRGKRALGPHFRKHKGYNWDDNCIGKTWSYTKKKGRNKKRPYGSISTKKYKQKKRQKSKSIMPEMQYIDVPAIIRIPISMGPIQIVSIERASNGNQN